MRPPEKDVGRARRPAATITQNTAPHHQTGAASHSSDSGRQSRYDALVGNRRRYTAARRVPPLECPGRCRDPLRDCVCELGPEPEPLPDRDLDAWADACRFLLNCGTTPLPPQPVLQALRRRSGRDRRLAKQIRDLTDGAA